jgi:glucosamine-6-phosphate deaminase
MNSADTIALSTSGLLEQARVDQLNIYRYESHAAVSAAAAHVVAAELCRLIATRGRAIGIFAADTSNVEFLATLVKAEGIEWTRVIGFHLNEYLGMDEDAPPSRRKFLLDHLVTRVPMAEFHGLRGEAANPSAVAANYAALLASRPPDFAVLEVGENGQLGFITATNCDFADPAAVRVVEVNKTRALTLTIPTLLACPRLFVTASNAVCAALSDAITPTCPASILRTHPDAHLFTH